MSTVVRYDEAAERYELEVDGEVVGHLVARDRGDVTELPHTVIDPTRRGHGLGEVLVLGALDDLRRRGQRVAPTCWFVDEVIDRHPETADLRVR